MTTHTIGSGGDFSTPQAWEDDILSVLVADRIGQCFNQEFDGAGSTVISFSAHDTTLGEIILETATGASFQDNANIRTNALRYNASNGAALKTNGNYNRVIDNSSAIGRLTIRKLQFKNDGSYPEVVQVGSAIFKDCIIEHTANGAACMKIDNGTIINTLIIQRGTGNGITSGANVTFINSLIIRPTNVTPAGTGIVETYSTCKLINTGVFGFSSVKSGTFDAASSNNATDLSSGLPGSSNQHSVVFSSSTPFINGTAASSAHDFRLANDGNSLINNGVLDVTNAPNDISLTARNNPPEISIWELSGAVSDTLMAQVLT